MNCCGAARTVTPQLPRSWRWAPHSQQAATIPGQASCEGRREGETDPGPRGRPFPPPTSPAGRDGLPPHGKCQRSGGAGAVSPQPSLALPRRGWTQARGAALGSRGTPGRGRGRRPLPGTRGTSAERRPGSCLSQCTRAPGATSSRSTSSSAAAIPGGAGRGRAGERGARGHAPAGGKGSGGAGPRGRTPGGGGACSAGRQVAGAGSRRAAAALAQGRGLRPPPCQHAGRGARARRSRVFSSHARSLLPARGPGPGPGPAGGGWQRTRRSGARRISTRRRRRC